MFFFIRRPLPPAPVGYTTQRREVVPVQPDKWERQNQFGSINDAIG
jgi:hypothetical protein